MSVSELVTFFIYPNIGPYGGQLGSMMTEGEGWLLGGLHPSHRPVQLYAGQLEVPLLVSGQLTRQGVSPDGGDIASCLNLDDITRRGRWVRRAVAGHGARGNIRLGLRRSRVRNRDHGR